MNVLRIVLCLLVAGGATVASFGQVPVSGGKGSSLQAIAGTDTLVTVVLKKTGAKDPNLKIVKVEDGILTVATRTGQNTSYLLSDVQEVIVQGEVQSVKNVNLMSDRGMNHEQQEIIVKALEKATELFNTSVSDQSLHMFAAEVLVVGGAVDANSEDARGGKVLSKQQASDYLTSLVNGNDLRTSLMAALHLNNAGAPIPSPDLIQRGMISGDRLVKSSAARLAGLTGDRSVLTDLRTMLQDRAANICAPAATALSFLGEKDTVPTMIAMIVDRNPDKANAAMLAIERMGDAETVKLLKLRLPETDGIARFRVARSLYILGDAEGGNVLRNELMDVPSMQFEAARTLALKGDVKAMQYLREWLSRKQDPTEPILIDRAKATHSLIKAGDRANSGVFQELLRDAPATVKIRVLGYISDLDYHPLLPMILPTLTGQDPNAAIVAAQTAVSMAHNDYRDRLRRTREE